MLGLVIEIGIRTAVWIITSSCNGIYKLCFCNKEQKLNDRIRILEEKVQKLEN